jgi:hypothetical protein
VDCSEGTSWPGPSPCTKGGSNHGMGRNYDITGEVIGDAVRKTVTVLVQAQINIHMMDSGSESSTYEFESEEEEWG